MTIRRLSHCFVLATLLIIALCKSSLAFGVELPQAQPDLQKCNELVNGDFLVKECIQLSRQDTALGSLPLSLPDQVSGLIATELQWAEPLLAETLLGQETSGTYFRKAKWQDNQAQDLGHHPFATQISRGEINTFDLEIANHNVQSLRVEIDQEGSGSLQILYESSQDLRHITLSKGLISSDRGTSSQNAGKFYMGCFIDTPAYDIFRPDYCAQLGYQPSSANFKVFLPYTPQAVVWSSPSSNCGGIFCTVPISPGQTVFGYAYWVVNNIPTGPVSATASYYSFE